MGEGGGGDGGSDIAGMGSAGIEFPADEDPGGCAEAAGDTAGLHAVSQPGADIIVLCQRKDLGLVLQTPETSGEDYPVEVPLERGTFRSYFSGQFTAEPVRRQ